MQALEDHKTMATARAAEMTAKLDAANKQIESLTAEVRQHSEESHKLLGGRNDSIAQHAVTSCSST